MSEPPASGPFLRRARAIALAVVVVATGIAMLLASTVRRPPAPPRPSTSVGAGFPDAAVTLAIDAAPSEPLDAGAPSAPAAASGYIELDGGTLKEYNDALLANMQHSLGLTPAQVDALRTVFAGSEYLGQGNPKPTRHPLSRAECLERRAKATKLAPPDLRCGAPNMVPLYDPGAGQTPNAARQCIDQYEFPNIECEYPVVWVRANEAQDLCHAVGKRLCDAHEWEGACAGAVKSPESEYAFGERRIMMQYVHNKDREIVWSYGHEKNHALCGTGSKKGPDCMMPSWHGCGSNDYPAGSFPDCVSPLGAYDLNGNAAEHMNFPRKPEELGSRGGSGETEMKGSWFIFQSYEAHEDDCRWRAPDWHESRITDKNSHRNYHLGFRCCKDLEAADAGASDAGASDIGTGDPSLDGAAPR